MSEPTEKTRRKTRSSSERTKVWQPPNQLLTPEAQEGIHYRWVRCSIKGETDDMNVVSRMRQHYEPVMASEVPGYTPVSVESGKLDGVVRAGDLILMKVPQDVVDQRNEYFAERAKMLMTSVKSDLMKQDSSIMPVSIENKTLVHTGRRPVIQDDGD